MYILGLDLGQAADYTALVVNDLLREHLGDGKGYVRHHRIRHLHRWPLGTTYDCIIADLRKLLEKEPLAAAIQEAAPRQDRPGVWETISPATFIPPPAPAGMSGNEHKRPILVVDATGCGRPIVDWIRKEQLPAKLVPITITAGGKSVTEGGYWRVSKRDLVGAMMATMQAGRFQIAPGLKLAKILKRELQAFSVKVLPSGSESMESWREKQHDDIVLACSLATWYAEKGIKWAAF